MFTQALANLFELKTFAVSKGIVIVGILDLDLQMLDDITLLVSSLMVAEAFQKRDDDTELEGVAHTTPESSGAIQKDLNRLEKRADKNLMKFKKGSHKVLHLGRNNPRYQYRPVLIQLESSYLGVLVDTKLNISQQCVLVAKKTKDMLGCMRMSVTSRSREVILLLYLEVRPSLESFVEFWAPQCKREMDVLEILQ
ncbi:rna-directed dna polymerase from mobile element jockey-like [Pitangus sulphuratus]|nr:rna-directed dna polymerase from mobile element jockey-like [Pitangus sulphuratus]